MKTFIVTETVEYEVKATSQEHAHEVCDELGPETSLRCSVTDRQVDEKPEIPPGYYQSPLHTSPTHITAVLQDMASREDRDGEPYDAEPYGALMAAAEYIKVIEANNAAMHMAIVAFDRASMQEVASRPEVAGHTRPVAYISASHRGAHSICCRKLNKAVNDLTSLVPPEMLK